MSDIVERIRNRINDAPMPTEHLLDEAADEIEALRAERDEASEHLAAVLFSDPGPKMLASIAAARAWWLEYDKLREEALTQTKDTTDDA